MKIFRKLGVKEMSFEEFRKRIAFNFIHFYNGVIRIFSQELDKIFFRVIRSNDQPKPFPGIKESLDFLRNKEIKLAVLSYHLQEELERDIKDWRFQGLFIDRESNVKNKKRAIIRLMRRNNFKPEETIYFGDMVLDIRAGKKAGVKTVAVSWGYQPRDKLRKAKPDFLIDNPSEIKRIIL